MASYRIEQYDQNGQGERPTRAYDMLSRSADDFWLSVTDVLCPCCAGTIRWAEAGHVPGYRICDGCGRHFLAQGNAAAPVLLRVGQRRSKVSR